MKIYFDIKHQKFINKLIFIVLIFYILSYCITYYRGADLSIYHLVIPDRIQNSLNLYSNVDFFGAKIPMSWHITALPLFILGGETAYLSINFWIYLIFIFVVLKKLVGLLEIGINQSFQELVALCVGAYIVFTLEGSITNTDLPSIFLESVIILILINYLKNQNNLLKLAIISGYCFSVKFTTIFTVVFIGLCVVLNKDLIRKKLYFITLLTLSSAIWPLYNQIKFNSLIPDSFSRSAQNINYTYLEQSLKEFQNIYSQWYLMNWSNLFTGGLSVVPIALIIIFLSLRIIVYNKKILYILLFGVGHFAVLITAVPRLDIVFHDRYHLITYICIILTAIMALNLKIKNKNRMMSIFNLSIVLITLYGFVYNKMVYFPTSPNSVQRNENSYYQIYINFKRLFEIEGDLVNRESLSSVVPLNSKIATNTIAPYSLNRDFIQLIPFVTKSIDISQNSKKIVCQLLNKNSEFIILYPSSSTIPGSERYIEKYMKNVRAIHQLNGVNAIGPITVDQNGLMQSGILNFSKKTVGCI